jgi:DNA repair exonuclease SbcCD nuclease subunit
MGRIFIISDTHIGCRSNSVLWLSLIEDYFFNFFIPLVKKEYRPGDVLYHLGDVFDNRQSINLAAQHLGIRVFEELSTIFPEIRIIVGNHDIMKKNSNDITSVDCLKYIPHVTVHKEPHIQQYGGVTCMLMPWRRDSAHEAETLQAVTQPVDYLFCHTETQGVQTSPSTKHLHEGGNPVSIFSGFKRVYSGHIHYRQEKKNFILVGNPYHMTRSDHGNTKGVYLLDLKTGRHKFYENSRSPRFIRYYIGEIMDRQIGEIIDEVRGNFVDLFIPASVLGKYDINTFMNFMDGVAHKLEPRIYDESSVAMIEEGSIADFKGELDLMQIAKIYIDGMNVDLEMRDRLFKSTLNLYQQTITPDYEDQEH